MTNPIKEHRIANFRPYFAVKVPKYTVGKMAGKDDANIIAIKTVDASVWISVSIFSTDEFLYVAWQTFALMDALISFGF